MSSQVHTKPVTLCWLLLIVSASSAVAQKDTDADGLLDVIDVTDFDANASGVTSYSERGIEDLDGVSQLIHVESLWLFNNEITSIENRDFLRLTNLQFLGLDGNRITSIESGDFAGLTTLKTLSLPNNKITNIETRAFAGLTNLKTLSLSNHLITSVQPRAFAGLTELQTLALDSNQTTNIKSGAFAGLTQLRYLFLSGNEFSELNFAGATFEQLGPRLFEFPLEIDNKEITSLILDDATLSLGSFKTITGETTDISDASLVGLTFSDANPFALDSLFEISSLDNVWVDQTLFDTYSDEFNLFDAVEGNTVTVVPLGDCSKDGSLSDSDLGCVFTIRSRDALLSALNTLPGDLDGDGNVAFIDFLKLAENFGKPSASNVEGNIDLKGGVAFADFLELANNFGKTPSDVAAVPEPGATTLVLLGFLPTFAYLRTSSRRPT